MLLLFSSGQCCLTHLVNSQITLFCFMEFPPAFEIWQHWDRRKKKGQIAVKCTHLTGSTAFGTVIFFIPIALLGNGNSPHHYLVVKLPSHHKHRPASYFLCVWRLINHIVYLTKSKEHYNLRNRTHTSLLTFYIHVALHILWIIFYIFNHIWSSKKFHEKKITSLILQMRKQKLKEVKGFA